MFPSAQHMPSAADEAERARILRDYGILDTGAEQAFDDLTALASQLCDAPASIVTFIDGNRLWFKSTFGLTATEAPVEHSFCAHAAGKPGEVFTIENALEDDRFLQNIFVMPEEGLRAYAGANIVGPAGVALGSICVVDFKERPFTDEQRLALERLSRQVVDQLELRRRVVQVERQRERFRREAQHFERVAHVLTHDFREPLQTQQGMIKAIQEDFGNQLPAGVNELLDMVADGANRSLVSLTEVARYLREGGADAKMEDIKLAPFLQDLVQQVTNPDTTTALSVNNNGVRSIRTQPTALKHILLNLLNNAVKYIGRPDGKVALNVERKSGQVNFCVSDNGPGIPAQDRERIFEPFSRSTSSEGIEGTGIGLSISQRLAATLGGGIALKDGQNGGCVFTLNIPG